MNAQQSNVREFMLAFDQKVRSRPTLPSDEEANLRIKLIEEEFVELQKGFVNGSLVEVADAIADLLYVVYGTACTCGLDAQKLMDEVHTSNMSKLWSSGEVATLLNRDAQEIYQYNSDIPLKDERELYIAKRFSRAHWIVKDKDGKVIKSPSYRKADIQQVLSLC